MQSQKKNFHPRPAGHKITTFLTGRAHCRSWFIEHLSSCVPQITEINVTGGIIAPPTSLTKTRKSLSAVHESSEQRGNARTGLIRRAAPRVAAGKSESTGKPRHRIRFVIFLRRKQKFGSHHFRPSTQVSPLFFSPRPANPRPHKTKRRIRMQGSLPSQIFDATRGQSATREVAAPRKASFQAISIFLLPSALALLLSSAHKQLQAHAKTQKQCTVRNQCTQNTKQKKKYTFNLLCRQSVSLHTAHCHLVMLHPIG